MKGATLKKTKKGKQAPMRPEQRPDQPTISVCMIAKDEEKHLERCLRSVAPVASEIIFVDTGSKDRTLAIAQKYTAKIWEHPWNDNFSEARNFAMSHATGDWILTMDADEELVAEDIPALREAAADAEADAAIFQIVNAQTGQESRGILNQERLLRNNGIIHYEGRVHNRPTGIERGKVCPVRIMHYGYDPATGVTEKKFQRTVKLLLQDLAENPNDPVTHHYLASSYLSREMHQEAVEHATAALRLAEAQKSRNMMFLWTRYNLAVAHYRLGETGLAEQQCRLALSEYGDHLDSHFLMIMIAYGQKRWTDLIHHAAEYLRLLTVLAADPGHFGTLVHCSLNERGTSTC